MGGGQRGGHLLKRKGHLGKDPDEASLWGAGAARAKAGLLGSEEVGMNSEIGALNAGVWRLIFILSKNVNKPTEVTLNFSPS